MLKQCLPSIWSDGDPASDQAKKTKSGSTGLCLHSVSGDRMRPVAILGVLDLSGIDRTLGGSVWSLPLERPVSRKRARPIFFLVSLSVPSGDPF